MKRKLLRDKKGFTLVELIVVLVILAILIALLVPALTGYIDKARKKAKMAECRLVVEAAQTCLSEMYGASENQDTATLRRALNLKATKKVILELSEVSGTISRTILITDKAAVSYLRYIAEDDTIVIYEKGHDPEYRIDENGVRYSEDAPGYSEQISDLDSDSFAPEAFLEEDGKTIKEEYRKYFSGATNVSELTANESKRLQLAYLKEYGAFSGVNWDEVKLPSGVRAPADKDDYVWKPIVATNGDTILVADRKGTIGNSQAAVVYYNGAYYYHWNGYNSSLVDSGNIGDKDFDISSLDTDPAWKKI